MSISALSKMESSFSVSIPTRQKRMVHLCLTRLQRQWTRFRDLLKRIFSAFLQGTSSLNTEQFSQIQRREWNPKSQTQFLFGELLTTLSKEEKKIQTMMQKNIHSFDLLEGETWEEWKSLRSLLEWGKREGEIAQFIIKWNEACLFLEPDTKKRNEKHMHAEAIRFQRSLERWQEEQKRMCESNKESWQKSMTTLSERIFSSINVVEDISGKEGSIEEWSAYLTLSKAFVTIFPEQAKDEQRHQTIAHLALLKKGEYPQTPFLSQLSQPQGLPNLGVTCWLNSMIQIFFSMESFVQQLRCPLRDKKSDPLRRSLVRVAQKAWKGNQLFTNREWFQTFIRTLSNKTSVYTLFSTLFPLRSKKSKEREASLESDSSLCQCLYDFFMTLRKAGEISDLQEPGSLYIQQDISAAMEPLLGVFFPPFKGEYRTSFDHPIRQKRCYALKEEAFKLLQVPIVQDGNKAPTVQGMIDKLFDKEIIQDRIHCTEYWETTHDGEYFVKEEGFYVDQVERTLHLKGEPPSFMPIQMKQFFYDKDNGKMGKIRQQYAMPLAGDPTIPALDFSKGFGSKTGDIRFQYVPTAFAVHCGEEAGNGHYVSCVYRPEKKQWYLCDDQTVEPISLEVAHRYASQAYIIVASHVSG